MQVQMHTCTHMNRRKPWSDKRNICLRYCTSDSSSVRQRWGEGKFSTSQDVTLIKETPPLSLQSRQHALQGSNLSFCTLNVCLHSDMRPHRSAKGHINVFEPSSHRQHAGQKKRVYEGKKRSSFCVFSGAGNQPLSTYLSLAISSLQQRCAERSTKLKWKPLRSLHKQACCHSSQEVLSPCHGEGCLFKIRL